MSFFVRHLSFVIRLSSFVVAAVLLLFAIRRWLFVVAALLPRRAAAKSPSLLFEVLLLVPVRNEAGSLPDLLWSLERLSYPRHKLTIVFVDDGSTDDSGLLLQKWVDNRQNCFLLSLPENAGKANALNAALAEYPLGEIIAVYDADERPLPNALQNLVRPFVTRRVGAVSGLRGVANALASPAAGYTAIESLVHQQITMQAKDRLNLAPAILGANCAYRRVALNEVGSFLRGVLLEDTDLTLKLAQTGWQTRFVPEAVSYHRVPESISGYWQQHTRWARGFNEVAEAQAGSVLTDPRLSPLLRLELLTFSLGYLDRVALLAGIGLSLLRNRLAAAAVVISLLTPFVQVIAALALANESPKMWLRLLLLPSFFALDIAMAATGFWHTLRRSPQIWEERAMRK